MLVQVHVHTQYDNCSIATLSANQSICLYTIVCQCTQLLTTVIHILTTVIHL